MMKSREILEKLNVKMVSTGQIVQDYLDSNEFSLTDLAKASGVSLRTIYRFINDESNLSYEIAEGINKLIPEISVDFLLHYDTRYQYQKKLEEKKAGLSNKEITALATKFKLKKFFPNTKGGNVELYNHMLETLGVNSLSDEVIETMMPSNISFSKSDNEDKSISSEWVVIALSEAKLLNSPLRTFSHEKLENLMDKIKALCKTTSFEQTINNIAWFAEECGINFYFRESVSNARIKGFVTKDEEGHIFLIMSDLFKCIERYWFTFIHEVLHIYNGDLDNTREISLAENEKKVDSDVISFLVANDMNEERYYSISELKKISIRNNVPLGLVAEIARFKSGNYKDYSINKLIHFTNESKNNIAL